MDLAPIDEQIADLKAKLTKLENAKRIILTLRGASNGQADDKPRDSASLPDPKELRKQRLEAAQANTPQQGGVDLRELPEKIACYLKTAQPATVQTLSDYFEVPRFDLMKVLQGDKRFTLGSKGWLLA